MAKVKFILLRDTRANQPSAADVIPGTLYCVTDEGFLLEQSNGSSWVTYATGASSIGTVLTADPGSPADDTFWVVRTGTTPGSVIQLKARVNGTTYVVAGVAI